MRAAEVRLLAAAAVAFGLARYLLALVKMAVESEFIDFAHYYTYAVVAAKGLDAFDPAAVAEVDRLLGLRRAAAPGNYPPLFYLLVQPWTLLPFRPAALAWLLVGQACLAGALVLALRRHPGASWTAVATALFVASSYQPLVENFFLGQANVVLLFLVALAWWGLRTDHPWVTAAAVATTLHVKPPYALLVAVLWWAGHARVAARAALLALAGLLAGVLVLGPTPHVKYLEYLLTLRTSLYGWASNFSPWATLHRVVPDSFANGLTLVVNLAVVLGLAWALPRRVPGDSRTMDWAWGLGLVGLLLLSPMLEEHYLVILLLPVTLIVLCASDDAVGTGDRVLLVASLLLLGVPYSLMRFAAFQSGPLALAASGKLAGVLGLAWLLVRLLRRGA
jgi:hypothetical protein